MDKIRTCAAVRKNSGKPAGIGRSSGNRRKIQSAQSRQNTGFPINTQAFQSQGTILQRARIWSRAKRISLASIPQRQARIPNSGIPNHTNAMRTRREIRWWKKVSFVFPRPFKMQPDEVAR